MHNRGMRLTKDFFRQAGSKGGEKAAKRMTKEQLRSRAMKGVEARKKKTQKGKG